LKSDPSPHAGPELPTLETARCVLTLLRPENAQLLLAYKHRNEAHLAPWEPTRGSSDATLEQACQRAAAQSAQGYARAYLHIAGRWEDMVLNARVHPQS
jgi:RimJ/RimL family protein N-acetyltransferase